MRGLEPGQLRGKDFVEIEHYQSTPGVSLMDPRLRIRVDSFFAPFNRDLNDLAMRIFGATKPILLNF